MKHKLLLRRVLPLLLASCIIIGITSCSNTSSENNDIITQKVVDKDKIPVTVLVKYAFAINAFEKAVEEKFPQLDIIQVGNYTNDRGLVEYERRLEHNDLTDIVMTWPLNVGGQYWDDNLLDLSGMPFTDRYNISMLDNISKDGKLYYIPGPAQVRGIVYNKTLFNENGWKVPTNFDEFVNLCIEIESQGIRSLQLGFGNSEVLDTALMGYSFGNCFSKPADAQWLDQYNNGIGSIGDKLKPALDTFQYMIDKGIWKESDLNVTYADREQHLFTRKCAMAEDSVLMARMGESVNGCTDEFGLMPFFTRGGDDWSRLYMVCYIGLNKQLAETKNKEKYNLIMQLMEYISTTEGQIALASDTGAMYSSVTEVPPPNIPEIADLLPSLTHGRYAVFPELKNAQTALREGLASMLRDELTTEDVIKMVDAKNIPPHNSASDIKIGTASEDFTLIETGNYITDAMRERAGSEIALFLDNGKDGRYNGKGVSGRLYEGEQTKEDVIRIMPDLKLGEAGILQKVTMSGEDLINALEYSLEVYNGNNGWFYYFSGLKVKYDPCATPGSRINKITDLEGKAIDKAKIYTVAIMDHSVDEKYIKSSEDTNILIKDLLLDSIKADKTITPSKDGRFTIWTSKK